MIRSILTKHFYLFYRILRQTQITQSQRICCENRILQYNGNNLLRTTLQADVGVDISIGMRAAAVADQSEDHVSSDKSQERQSRLQLQRHTSISSGHHL